MARKGRMKSKDKSCLFAADGNESFTGHQYTKYSPLSHSNCSPLLRLCIIYTLSKPAAWLAEAFPATAPNTPQAGGLRG